jgi:mannose-6-phosphate isomerase-like protein (cupin superfamily)
MPVLPAPSSATHVGRRSVYFVSDAELRFNRHERGVSSSPPGHPATPHQVTREEVFVVLSGRARVRLGDDVHEACAGDTIVVPRDTNFEITVEGDEPLQALCCMPVNGEARLADGTTFVPPWAR